MFEDVVAFLVVGPFAGVTLALAAWVAWARRPAPVTLKKELRISD